MSLIKRNNLREQVREIILQRIGREEYASGKRLVESKLAEELHVSTVPVREAIRELAAIGILDFEPHKGARVRKVGVLETIEALQVKEVLEPLAARLAGAAMRQHCPALRGACGLIMSSMSRRDFVAFQDHNQTFHHIIVKASGNAALMRTWSSLAFEARTRFIMDYLASEDSMRIAGEHRPIVEAFEHNDTERAAQLLASHSHHLIEFLRRQMVPAEKAEAFSPKTLRARRGREAQHSTIPQLINQP